MVRRAREARGWSRFRLMLEVRQHFRKEGSRISECAIVYIETGITKEPRAMTRNMLVAVLPDLKPSNSN